MLAQWGKKVCVYGKFEICAEHRKRLPVDDFTSIIYWFIAPKEGWMYRQ